MKRFWDKVKQGRPGECWEWKASRNELGYGIFSIKAKPVRANRMAYELANGPIPEGLHVLHSCDNRACCNPQHLRLGTPYENAQDRVTRQRGAFGARHGLSKLTEMQVQRIRILDRALPDRHLAELMGVAAPTVSSARRSETWKHITSNQQALA